MSKSVCVITGGFGVLGRAVAVGAQARGDQVVLVDRGPPAAFDGALCLDGVDLTDVDAASRVISEVQGRFGRIDSLINTAGGFRWQTLADGSPGAWAELFAINALTAAHACRAAAPFMCAQGQGRIINVGAAAALKAGAGMGAYAASKAAVHALTQSLAEELKDTGVTVNAVLPSIIDTPANRADMPQADPSAWVAPEALASVILFLASDAAAAVTGALLPVTGRV